jgi:hypothetical protein
VLTYGHLLDHQLLGTYSTLDKAINATKAGSHQEREWAHPSPRTWVWQNRTPNDEGRQVEVCDLDGEPFPQGTYTTRDPDLSDTTNERASA